VATLVAVAVAVIALVPSPGAAAPAQPSAGELTVAWAIALGALQGITEFLPISSDGHLALAQRVLGIDAAAVGHRFTILVHAGTLLAVIWHYRTDLLALATSALRPGGDPAQRRLLAAIAIASVPLGIVLVPGIEELVIAMESQVRAIGFALWLTAAALFVSFRGDRGATIPAAPAVPSPWQALLIGLAQVTAVLPGISRSGTTIAAGLGVGIDRVSAARFSFLLSVPAVGGAVAKETLELVREPAAAAIDPWPYAVGFAVSLVVGLAALRVLLLLVGRGRVMGFVAYLAVLGAIAVALG
jgi:undecaprenyl-diphosphatase